MQMTGGQLYALTIMPNWFHEETVKKKKKKKKKKKERKQNKKGAARKFNEEAHYRIPFNILLFILLHRKLRITSF